MCVSVVCVDERTTCQSQFSPTVNQWILRMNSDGKWPDSKYLTSLSHVTGPRGQIALMLLNTPGLSHGGFYFMRNLTFENKKRV